MTTLYKLTDQKGYTKNNIKWQVGISHELPECNNPQLCSGDVFHAYTSFNLGLLLNPIHADISNPRLFACEGEIVVSDWGKVGSFKLTVIDELSLPEWYIDKNIRKRVQVQFAILCAESVLSVYESCYPDNDRPRKAIEVARNYLNISGVDAARAAAYDADAADAADAAYDAYDAYDAAAAYAARAAAYAARAAEIDFGHLADLAVGEVMNK